MVRPGCQNLPVHTGDAEEQALFERLEREFADVRVPRARRRRRSRPAQRRRRERLRRVIVTVVSLAVTLVAAVVVLRVEYGIRITASGLLGPERLRPEVTASTSGSFSYSSTRDYAPVTYSPCKPIPLVINSTQMPPGAHGLVHDAVRRVVSLTGLDLRVEGQTDEQPSAGERPGRLRQYGNRWAPVLVAWSDPRTDPALEGDVAGVGGSLATTTSASGRPRYVTGSVSLDSPALAAMLELPRGRALVRAVIMHELAHVVGLGHVDDPGELMHGDNHGLTDFGPGDREGLATLGRGPCL
jgi:hypothetical protein